MNIRFSSDGIKFRLGQGEYQTFLENGSIEETISIPGGLSFKCRVTQGKNDSFSAIGSHVEFAVAPESLEVFSEERITKKSNVTIRVNETFKAVLEIDAFDDVRRAKGS